MFTFFNGCGIPPVTLTCGQGAQAQTILGPTGTQGCTVIGPTGYQGCGIGHGAQAQNVQGTAATICTQYGCNPIQTWFHGCGIPPVTLTCNQGGAQAQTIFPTALGCLTATTTVQPQIQNVGPTGYQGCTIPPNCFGPTGYQGCGQQIQGGGNNTLATVCTQIGCGPTHLIGCTGYQGCHQGGGSSTLATVCTQVACNQGGAQAQIPSIPVADCIPTRSCTGAWPVC